MFDGLQCIRAGLMSEKSPTLSAGNTLAFVVINNLMFQLCLIVWQFSSCLKIVTLDYIFLTWWTSRTRPVGGGRGRRRGRHTGCHSRCLETNKYLHINLLFLTGFNLIDRVVMLQENCLYLIWEGMNKMHSFFSPHLDLYTIYITQQRLTLAFCSNSIVTIKYFYFYPT